MPDRPRWYTQVHFTNARPIPLLRPATDIPDRPGCYVFTSDAGPLVPGAVLYVGKAIDLRSRVRGYLVNYMSTAPTTHKGRAFLFEYRHLHGDAKLFLRWTLYGDPVTLEGSLIDYLEPQFNDRMEPALFADDEELDPRYMLRRR